jgi:hypothetical protein
MRDFTTTPVDQQKMAMLDPVDEFKISQNAQESEKYHQTLRLDCLRLSSMQGYTRETGLEWAEKYYQFVLNGNK